jgi:hypothetical protein
MLAPAELAASWQPQAHDNLPYSLEQCWVPSHG